jgi:LmbE family N-acetylglucosaminyl deacetylase
MTVGPVICFGQQPCGFFPKRFLVAKIRSARRLQQELGGEIVFFYHDSDHDPRETRTILHRRKTEETACLNFSYENKLQRKFSPLYLKRIPADWHARTLLQLPNYIEHAAIDLFRSASAATEADFCLEMYRRMGLLEGIRVARSSDPAFRRAACPVADFYVDVPYEGEVVRARHFDGGLLKLHEGGNSYMTLPPALFTKEQVSPTRDSRLCWMQSGVHCTHYIAGVGEQQYLKRDHAPEIAFITRDAINNSDEAYPNSTSKAAPLLAFGAHPDDIEFGCGGVIARETQAGRPAHFIVCSRGESGTHGKPAQRAAEAKKAAALLGATLGFVALGGDAHFEIRVNHILKLARALRQHRPGVVLAPSSVESQHPDHVRLGQMVRDAARLARYGGVKELKDLPPHAVGQLFLYAVTPEAEPVGITPILVDVSAPAILNAWTAAMKAHATQTNSIRYVELQLTRARLRGLRAGVGHAIALFPNEPLLVDSLTQLGPGARAF